MTEDELEEYKKANPKGRRTTIDTIFGDAAMTYIQEKKFERNLGRSLTEEINAKPVLWGKHLEGLVFELLSTAYRLTSKDTITHPDIAFWAGSPDGETSDAVMDIKCPITLKSFCQLVQPLYDGLAGMDAINKIRDTHKDGDKYYWQLVSNAILTKKKFAELIVYCPYKSELETIRATAEGDKRLYWIWAATDDELPYLIEGGYYKNINIIRFEVPEEDKELLTSRVIESGKLLIV